MFKDWTISKWIGKLSPVVVFLLTDWTWKFIELPIPEWAPVIAGAITILAQTIIALLPKKG